MNDVLGAIKQRATCRDYSNQTPREEDIKAIAQAALQSPSARNIKPYQIIMVTNKQLINHLDEAGIELLSQTEEYAAAYKNMQERGGKLFYNAPCMAILAVDESQSTGYERLDCGIVAENIVLAATSLGFGSTHCGFAQLPFKGPRGKELKKQFQIPENYEVCLAVLFGYANFIKEPHEIDQNKITWLE